MFNKLFLITVIAIMILSVSCKKDPTSSNVSATFNDLDGNVYNTIIIGSQVWMAENLKVTHYRNGEPIPNVTNNAEWAGLSTGAYCSYNNNNDNVNDYGLMYNWHAVNDNRNLAPEGWHVPTEEDWQQLDKYLGMSDSEINGTRYRGTDEGGKLKETGTLHWNSPNTGATNSSGFSALPGGFRHLDGSFYSIGVEGYWWSSTEHHNNEDVAWVRKLAYTNSNLDRAAFDAHAGYSVRCIRD